VPRSFFLIVVVCSSLSRTSVEFPEFIVIVDFLRRASMDSRILDRLRNAFTHAKKFATKDSTRMVSQLTVVAACQ
jgi:hypothetical protein